MTVDEARHILQAESCTSLRELRRNYLRLMKECHPDNKTEYRTGLDPRLLNEAYHMLLQIPLPVAARWDADLAGRRRGTGYGLPGENQGGAGDPRRAADRGLYRRRGTGLYQPL